MLLIQAKSLLYDFHAPVFIIVIFWFVDTGSVCIIIRSTVHHEDRPSGFSHPWGMLLSTCIKPVWTRTPWEHRCQPSRILRGYPAFSTKFCKNPVINNCPGGVTNYPKFPQSAPSGNVVSHISWFSRRPFAFSINKPRHYKSLIGNAQQAVV